MFDPIILSRAQARLSEGRAEREARAVRRRDNIYANLPDIELIDAEMRTGLLRAVREAFSGNPGCEIAMETCRERNLALRAKRSELLQANGYPPGVMDNPPECLLCSDTGFSDGAPCACLRLICADMQWRCLDERLDLRRQNFESFDLSLFSPEEDPLERESPRDRMKLFLEYCRKYARRFGRDSANLLLRGDPGLGKTFLCACIAGVVSAGPHWVIYETSVSAVALMEGDKFSRDFSSGEQTERLFECDLLLLDDLGAEFSTPFSHAALFSLLSARISGRRPTVATTVLREEDIRRRYPPQLTSRLESFELLPLFGADLRRK